MMTIASLLFAVAWSAHWVDPYPVDRPEAFSLPADAKPITAIDVSAAKGEYESYALRLEPQQDIDGLDFVFSDLTGPGGAKISADEIDVKVVKYWWRPRNSWVTASCGDLAHLVLTPDMLLHDDTLVKVDESTNQVNWVRADYESGSVYLNMREPGKRSEINYMLEPIADAPKFRPIDLKKGKCREFFVCFHVPEDAAAGDYKGEVTLVAGGKPTGSLGVSLTVYPFVLPRARTHYDTSREYHVSMYNNANVGNFLSLGKDLALAERCARNTARECARHNFLHPMSPGEFKSLDWNDLCARTLAIWRQEGLPCTMLIAGSGQDSAWCQKKVKGEPATPWNDWDATMALAKGSYAQYVDLQLKGSEKFLGHRNWFFYAIDEAGPSTQRRQFGFWRQIKDRGGKIYASTMGDQYRQCAWMDDVASAAARCDWQFAEGWHGGGARVLTYAATFCGPECPDLWRRQKGIRFYFADFDGTGDYCFYTKGNRWNDLNKSDSGYRQLGMVYPTRDGFVGTVPFEALREAVDDIRYFSLHRLLAERAIASGEPAKLKRGRAEIAWIDNTDPEFVHDLLAFRAEVARRIVSLQELVGPLPPEPKIVAPELPPATLPAVPSDPKAAMRLADEWVAADRWDAALLVYEKLMAEAAGADKLPPAFAAARLLNGPKRRDRALALLKDLEKLELMLPQRFDLLESEFGAMTTDERFEERFDLKRIQAAKKIYDETAKPKSFAAQPPIARRRFAMLLKLVDLAAFGRQAAYATELIDGEVERGAFPESERLQLIARQAEAASEAGNVQAVVDFTEKALRFGLDGNKNLKYRIFAVYAPACERLKLWDKAWSAYSFIITAYEPKGETEHLFKRTAAKMKELDGKRRKSGRAAPTTDGEDSISLDE